MERLLVGAAVNIGTGHVRHARCEPLGGPPPDAPPRSHWQCDLDYGPPPDPPPGPGWGNVVIGDHVKVVVAPDGSVSWTPTIRGSSTMRACCVSGD